MTPTIDPIVLPNATCDVPAVETPEGSAHDASRTYTIEDEQKGDTLSGTKEMRAEGGNENKNSSKRPKGPLPPNEAE